MNENHVQNGYRPLLFRLARAFLKGLSKPSLVALLVALFTTSALFVCSPFLVRQYTDQAVTDNDSGHTGRTTLIEAMMAAPPIDPGQTITILGTSRIGSALETNADMERLIAQRSGLQRHVRNWAIGGLTLAEIKQLIRALPNGFQGVVVLAIHAEQLLTEDRRLVRSNYFIQKVITIPPKQRPGEYRTLVLPRSLYSRLLVERWHDSRFEVLKGLKDWLGLRVLSNKKDWEGIQSDPVFEKNRDIWRRYDERISKGLLLITECITLLHDQGCKVILLESPVNPMFVMDGIGSVQYKSHILRMRTYAKKVGVTYLNVNPEAGLKPQDFRDAIHVESETAKRLFTTAFANRLADWLADWLVQEGVRE